MQARKLLRFSLRSFLVVVTVIAVWLALHLRSVEKQKKAVAGISDFGGWVYYDFHYPSGNYELGLVDPNAEPALPGWLIDSVGVDFFYDVVAVNLFHGMRNGKQSLNSNHSDDAMPYLAELDELRVVSLDLRQATGESMACLANARKLECLYVSECLIGDEGVAHLQQLTRLRRVVIHNGALSDQSLETFGRLPNLTHLRLSGSSFSNAGLAAIAGHPELVDLNLNDPNCRIDDDGLLHLAGMNQLKNLALEGSYVSDAGLKHLEKLPSLRSLAVGETKVTWRGADTWKKTLPRSVQFNGKALRRK